MKNYTKAAAITEAMVKHCHTLDDTRPVVNALNPLCAIMGDTENPEQHRSDMVNPREPGKGSGLAGSQLANTLVTLMPVLTKIVGNEKAMNKKNAMLQPLDIVGFNYADFLYEPQHKDHPKRLLCGTETYPSHIAENWAKIKKMPWVVGDFMWTACDYLGEAGVGWAWYGKQQSFTQEFPGILAGCSSIDLIGDMKCQGLFTKTVFGQAKKPYLAVHPMTHAGEKLCIGQWSLTDALHSWSWEGCEGKKGKVDVYSDSASVEQFCNGKSYGKKKPEGCKAVYEIPYEAGELKAVSYDKAGKVTGEDILRSAGSKVQLQVIADKKEMVSGGGDILYLSIALTDEEGNLHILKDRKVSVEVEGAAYLLGLGSSQRATEDLTPYTHKTTMTCEGKALAVLRSKEEAGEINVMITADGMAPISFKMTAV